MAGPRSLPPMPMLTTVCMVSPVAPRHAPLRTRSANVGHPPQHLVHIGDDVVPVEHHDRVRGAHAARCAARHAAR